MSAGDKQHSSCHNKSITTCETLGNKHNFPPNLRMLKASAGWREPATAQRKSLETLQDSAKPEENGPASTVLCNLQLYTSRGFTGNSQ